MEAEQVGGVDAAELAEIREQRAGEAAADWDSSVEHREEAAEEAMEYGAHDHWYREVATDAEVLARDRRIAEARLNVSEAFDRGDRAAMDRAQSAADAAWWAVPESIEAHGEEAAEEAVWYGAHDYWYREVATDAEVLGRDRRIAEARLNVSEALDRGDRAAMDRACAAADAARWAVPESIEADEL